MYMCNFLYRMTIKLNLKTYNQMLANANIDSPHASNMSAQNRHFERFQWVIDTISMARALETPLFQGDIFSSKRDAQTESDAQSSAAPGGNAKTHSSSGRNSAAAHSKLAAEFQKFRFVEPFECHNPFVATAPSARQSDLPRTCTTPTPTAPTAAAAAATAVHTDANRAAPTAGAQHSAANTSVPGSGERVERDMRKIMKLTDAGVHFNAPFPAVLRPHRRSDVIVCLDARSLAGMWWVLVC